MVTQRGASLLIGGVLLWLVGRSLGVPELYIAAVAAAALVGAGALAVRLGSAHIVVRRHLEPRRLLHGRQATITLDLHNDARWDTAALLLVEDSCPRALVERPVRLTVGGLRPRRTMSLSYRLSGARRGRFTVGPARIRVRDPFGLVERIRQYAGTTDVIVYPRIEPLSERLSREANRGSETSDVRRLLNAGDEFYTMREYATGDDLRQVHWPSTARRQRLMVRQHELPWQSQATILCDTRTRAHRGVGPDSTLERAISVTASLIWHLADHGYQLRLLTETDARAPQVSPWGVLLDRLATTEASVEPHLGPALLRLRSSGAEGLFAAVVTGGLEGGDLQALLRAGRSFAGRAAIVIDVIGGRGGGAAAETAGVLAASGWRATVLGRGEPLAAAWRRIVAARRRAGVGASR